jgi:hypothetical protein
MDGEASALQIASLIKQPSRRITGTESMGEPTGQAPAESIGYNTAAIHNLICSAFSVESLHRFCRDQPVLRPLRREFTPSQGLNDMADEIITYCETQLLWEELLAAIARERDRQYRLVEPILRDPDYVGPMPSSEQIGQGFEALTDLMQAGEVRIAVVTFRADFRAARDQIILLSNLKYLHDLLHELQFHCYTPVLQAARHFPDDDLAVESLEYYEVTFQRIVGDLKAIAGQAIFAGAETLWVEDLVGAEQALGTALRDLDGKQLKRAIWILNRVLSIQPSRINTRLNAAAGAMRLPALVEAITFVCDHLLDPSLDSVKVSQFQSGMQALTHLLHQLSALVVVHDAWQAVDLELRRIEAIMGQDTEELEMSWPSLKAIAEPLYSSSGAGWAKSLRKDAGDLDRALEAGNPAKVKRSFRRYRRWAGSRFHKVDLDLKRLCQELSSVGEPLDLVMRMIE